MPLPDIFDAKVSNAVIQRIEQLQPDMKPIWGSMNAAQMLAHCNVSYEYVFEPSKYKPTPGFIKFMLRLLLKNTVVSEKPYKHNSGTGPDFKVPPQQDFEDQKSKIINYIKLVQQMGRHAFEGRSSHSFGVLTAQEWNNMFYKHLDHHLRQFGV